MERSLDDLALFIAVADAGGLAGAARATGASVPTLSRRMTALERALGARLFERGKRGYTLTAQGRDLLAEAAPLRDAAARLARFGAEARMLPVRITAGLWTSRFIARHLDRLWTPGAGWVPQMLASNADVDIARREADIGIRNRRPSQAWLAGRATIPIHFAEYARDAGVTGYITLPATAASTPSERWLRARHPDAIVTTASDARLARDMAVSGLGRVILPTFAGDESAGLVRVSPPIADLTHEEWMVCHHDARHDPPIRAALDALAALLTDRTLRPAPLDA